MKIIKMVSEGMAQNTYLVVNNKDAILIDCGVGVDEIEANLKLQKDKPTIRGVLLTHEHFDHILELDNVLKKYGCLAYIHENGKNSLYNENENMSILDDPFKIKNKKEIKKFKDGDILEFGEISVICHHTPGHSLGSSCFVIDNNMFTGDTIFKVDYGRSDLFGGDPFVQKVSFEKIRSSLINDVENFYPGHGGNFDKEDLIYNLKHFFGEE